MAEADLAERVTDIRAKVSEKVINIIREHLGTDSSKTITENAKFVDDLGADSLDIVELIMAFEEEFGIEISDETSESIQTVGDAIDHLEKVSVKTD